MEDMPNQPETVATPLASNLRKFREEKELSLDEVAKEAGISKAYLWELERDTADVKKPSADVLMRIAKVLKRTLEELLALPTVQTAAGPVEVPQTLQALRDRLKQQGQELTDQDLRDLASMRFRGTQPQSPDDWHQLYLLWLNATRAKPK